LTVTLPDSWFDEMLLRTFPGRTLEELDGVNWLRLWRALEVREIRNVEEMREQFLAGRLTELPASTWQMIRRHDRMITDG
jgi:hypothetical protein